MCTRPGRCDSDAWQRKPQNLLVNRSQVQELLVLASHLIQHQCIRPDEAEWKGLPLMVILFISKSDDSSSTKTSFCASSNVPDDIFVGPPDTTSSLFVAAGVPREQRPVYTAAGSIFFLTGIRAAHSRLNETVWGLCDVGAMETVVPWRGRCVPQKGLEERATQRLPTFATASLAYIHGGK